MDRKKLLWILVLVPFLWQSPLFMGLAQSQSNPSLGGLTSMYVRVQPQEGSQETTGINLDQLRADTEEQLSKAGITILPQQEFERLQRSRGYPLALLDVDIGVFPIQGVDLKMYSISIRVRQSVFLSRKPVIRLWAPTWEMRDTGTTDDVASIPERVRGAVSRLVGDYQSENPK
ncbi:MAG: hypothetical protein PVG99_00110 [Desulfobacteraceae bacterium]|jgi:hypothetical protein